MGETEIITACDFQTRVKYVYSVKKGEMRCNLCFFETCVPH